MSDARCWGSQAPGGSYKSRWNQWLETQYVAGSFDYQHGDRIFEFSDNSAHRGWKPYDKDSQIMLRRIFSSEMNDNLETAQVPLNCLGWMYLVKFDLFHKTPQDFLCAPSDAIGFQLSSHEASDNTKRWIRLATF